MTMSSQLWRTVLAGSSVSSDQQEAAPDEKGSYGDLADTIDEILAEEKDEPALDGEQGPEAAGTRPARRPD
jgi:hypothetical protein